MSEEWRESQFKDYWVSSLGRIMNKRNNEYFKGTITPKGYYRVSPYRKHRFLHVLIAECFIGPKPPNHQVNHRDGNKLNNRIDNLEYVTNRQNLEHAYDLGRKRIGENHGMSTITSDQARKIMELARTGCSQWAISKELKISQYVVSGVIRGKSWIHATKVPLLSRGEGGR